MITAPSGTVYTGRVKSIVYTFPSVSEPGVRRTTRANPLTGRPMSCDCPAGRWDKDCKHKQAVRAGTAGRPRVTYGPVVAREVRRPVAAVSDLYPEAQR